MHLLRPRKSLLAKGLGAVALALFAFGAAVALADDPNGPPGKVDSGAKVPAAVPEKPRSGFGVLADGHFDNLTADNTCVGDATICTAGYTPGEDLEVTDSDPHIYMLNAHPGNSPTRFWDIDVDSSNNFTLTDRTGTATRPFTLENNAPTDSLHVDSSGNVGLGTASPAVDLHLARAGSLRFRIEDTSSTDRTDLYQGGSGLWFEMRTGANAATTPVKIDNGSPTNTLTVNSTGRVGIGKDTPLTRLQVGPGSTGVATAGASILAEEGVASAMILKSTSGPEMFLYEDQNNGLMGTASNTPFGLRTNNANRFWMDQNGNVGIGTNFTNPQHLLQVFNAGGAYTDGSSWINASSRSLKENFQATNDQSILEKLVSLPVDSWNYKVEGDGIRHLGPTAEDFMTTFGLGSNDKAISTVDADGVAMAAIKGLYDQVKAKDSTIARVSSENAKLQQRLDALESRMNGLDGGAPAASASSHGDNVATSTIVAALALVAFGAVAGLGLSLARRRA